MNKSEIIALYDQDQRKDVEYPDMRREITPDVVRHIDTSGMRKGIISYSQLNESNTEDVIREQVNFFESMGHDFEWKLYDYDQPSDLKERLESYGFVSEEAEAILVLDLEDAPEVLWQSTLQPVQRITDPENYQMSWLFNDRFGRKTFRRWVNIWARLSASILNR